MGFVAEAWHVLEPTKPFSPNWHLDAIAEHLQAVTLGQIPLLQINVPPGFMKSLMASVMFGAWEWGPAGLPGLRYLTTSYKEEHARRDSRKMRDLIESEWYQTLWPAVKLLRNNEADFENSYRGGRRALAFGSLTSGRGNRVIIDDPHSTETAESLADRETATRIFTESVPSRINDPVADSIIVIMQRLHPEDVCGVIDEYGLPYTKLILPMEYHRSLVVKTPFYADPRKDEGELLDPKRFPPEYIALKKKFIFAYDTQFQQQPRARSGSYFFAREHFLIEATKDVFEPAPMPTRCDAVLTVIDTASKVGKERDGTGFTTYAYTKFPTPKLEVLDWDLIQIEADLLINWLPGIMKSGEALARQCGARAGYLGAWIEDKDSGVVLIRQGQRLNLPVQAIDSKLTAAGKDGRAVSVSGYIHQGLVKITQPAWEKTIDYKGRSKNHWMDQATTYRVGRGTPNDEDELFDTLCYGTAITLGNIEGF